MSLSRRGLFLSAGAFLAAPAIVRVASIMPVSVSKLIAPHWETLHHYRTFASGEDWKITMSGWFMDHRQAMECLRLRLPGESYLSGWTKTGSKEVLV